MKELEIVDKPEPKADESEVRFEPLYNLVLIRPIDKGDYKEGRLFIPQTSTIVNQGVKCGEVIATGCGRLMTDGRLEPLKVKPGDEIYYVAISGAEIRLDGERLLILREEEIMGIFHYRDKPSKLRVC